MAYKLEHSLEEQRSLISSTMQKWSNCQPDMYIISTEGHKIYTQRILLGLYSDLVDQLLTTPGLGDLPGISVPASSGCLVNLLKILTTGVAIASNKAHLLEATKAAEVLGFKLENCQIGIKKKKPEVIVNQESLIDKKRKAENNENIPRVNVVPKVKQEVDESDNEFNDLLLSGPDISINEGPDKFETKVGTPKKHQCSQCDKAFTSKQSLQRHSLSHTANPFPFACQHCDKKFDRNYRLNKHVKAVHSDVPDPKTDERDGDINVANNDFHDQTTEVSEDKDETQENIADEIQDDCVDDATDVNADKVQDESISEMDEHNSQDAESMELDEMPSENKDFSGVLSKDHEKLLSDRKKLLAELSDIEGEKGELDFLNLD